MIEGLKVYRVNDSDCWVTDSIDNLKKSYKEQTGEDIDEDVLEESDLDKEGMYWDFDGIPEMQIVIRLLIEQSGNCDLSSSVFEIEGEKYYFSLNDTYGMHISFRRALELDGTYKNPHLLASTPY